MWFGVVTLHPELFHIDRSVGVFARAWRRGVISIDTANPRDFASDRHHSVDDQPYGGGDGMLMMVQPLARALAALQAQAPANTPVIMLSPQGLVFDQQVALTHAKTQGMIFICGRF